MSAGTPVTNTQPVVKLRPSDAHRWLVCRAAPGYCARLEAEGRLPKEEFDYTLEGIEAHKLAALALRGEPLPDGADPLMVQHVLDYAAYVRRQLEKHRKHEPLLLVEESVVVFYSPSRRGYVDAAVVVLDGERVTHLYVTDLKYGRGVSVEAKRNPQLSIYVKSLLGWLREHFLVDKKTEVHVTIWQPRVQGEKVERSWPTDAGTIDNYCLWVEEVAKDIHARPFEQKFEPSDDACQFCPAAGLCDARARDLLGNADETLAPIVLDVTRDPPVEQIDPPDPTTLTPEQVARVLKAADPLRAWLKKVESYALAAMEQNLVKIPGQKLVRGRPGNRRWRDAAEAEKWLRRLFPRDVVTPPSVISPAQAEVLLKERKARQVTWDGFEKLVVRPEGNLALADEADERPAVDPRLEAAEHFDEEGSELL